MIRNVLLVDDDQILLKLIKKYLSRYKDTFSLLTASNGLEAIDLMKEKPISLVVTDLQMPKMDGFTLIAHLIENYPDIPTIVITGLNKPKIKQAILEKGAIGFIEKPFNNINCEELSRTILSALNKELEGGTLNNVSLETFIQLVEMEQKTCTIRVLDKQTDKRGVLFFKDGEMLNARINDIQGNQAAYEIFSWDKITLAIENDCAQKKKNIEGDLQGILLESMRLKDEAAEINSKSVKIEPSKKIETNYEDNNKQEESKQISLVEQIRKKIEKILGNKSGLQDIYSDNSKDDLISQISVIGKYFNAGDIKALFIDNGSSNDFIIIPREEVVTMAVNHQCPRDRILKLLSE